MAGSSAFFQRKHKRIIGPVEHVCASKCHNCGGLTTRDDIFKGWCGTCISMWGNSIDPSVLMRVQSDYAAAQPPTVNAYEHLKTRIAERLPDEWFVPLTLFAGNVTVGRMQAIWNFVQAMYELEIQTTAEAFKLGKESHDAIHLCGLHAAVQPSTIGSFLSRLIHSPSSWDSADPHIREYVRGFINDNRSIQAWALGPRRRISEVTHGPNHKCRRSYRLNQDKVAHRAAKQADVARNNKLKELIGDEPIPAVPAFWPFAVRRAPDEHQMLHEIDSLTRGIPEQWRQDVCQDLVVAVLSGEVTLENLRDALPQYIKKIFKFHPIKYGDVSIDAPIHGDGTRTLAQLLAYVQTDEADETQNHHESEAQTFALGGWHEGFNRPVGLTRMGDLLRHKHGGRAID